MTLTVAVGSCGTKRWCCTVPWFGMVLADCNLVRRGLLPVLSGVVFTYRHVLGLSLCVTGM